MGEKENELEGIGIDYGSGSERDAATDPMQEEEYLFLDEDEMLEDEQDRDDLSPEVPDSSSGFGGQMRQMVSNAIGEENMDKFKGMLIPMLIGGVFVIYAFFKIIGLFTGNDTPSQTGLSGGNTQFTQTITPVSKSTSTTPQVPKTPAPVNSFKTQTPQKPTGVPQVPSIGQSTPATTTPLAPVQQQPKTTEMPEPKQATQPLMSTQTEQPLQLPTISTQQTVTPAQQALLKDLLTRLQAIESQNNAVQASIKEFNESTQDLNTRMRTLESSLNKITATLGKVNKNVSDIENTVTKQEDKTSYRTGPSAFSREQAGGYQVAAPEFRTPRYRVDAVIPGRAWLKAENGSTITVSKGDQVRGYGYVTLIDAEEGLVVTSSGIVFRYGINSQQ